jgi:hypothetical protein
MELLMKKLYFVAIDGTKDNRSFTRNLGYFEGTEEQITLFLFMRINRFVDNAKANPLKNRNYGTNSLSEMRRDKEARFVSIGEGGEENKGIESIIIKATEIPNNPKKIVDLALVI